MPAVVSAGKECGSRQVMVAAFLFFAGNEPDGYACLFIRGPLRKAENRD